MKIQKEHSLGNVTWSEMGKQNVQAKEVHWPNLRSFVEDVRTWRNILNFLPEIQQHNSCQGLTAEYPATRYAETDKFELKCIIYSKEYFNFEFYGSVNYIFHKIVWRK